MNHPYLSQVNEAWENFKKTFSEKKFPNEFIQTFFINASIVSIEDISAENDGSWLWFTQLNDPVHDVCFSFVLNGYGFVGNLKGNAILSQIQGSEVEQWGTINRIFEGFQPLVKNSLYLAKITAI